MHQLVRYIEGLGGCFWAFLLPFLILPWIFWHQLPGSLVSAAHLSPLASRLTVWRWSQLWHGRSVGFVWCSHGDLCRGFLSCVVSQWNVCKVVFAKEQILTLLFFTYLKTKSLSFSRQDWKNQSGNDSGNPFLPKQLWGQMWTVSLDLLNEVVPSLVTANTAMKACQKGTMRDRVEPCGYHRCWKDLMLCFYCDMLPC